MTNPAVGRIREHSTFRALRRRCGRASAGPIRVAYVPPLAAASATFPQVAYAIGRRHGNAVTRNRLRRRLRAAAAAVAEEVPTGAYLVTARPEAATLAYPELVRRPCGQALMAPAGSPPHGGRAR